MTNQTRTCAQIYPTRM